MYQVCRSPPVSLFCHPQNGPRRPGPGLSGPSYIEDQHPQWSKHRPRVQWVSTYSVGFPSAGWVIRSEWSEPCALQSSESHGFRWVVVMASIWGDWVTFMIPHVEWHLVKIPWVWAHDRSHNYKPRKPAPPRRWVVIGWKIHLPRRVYKPPFW